MRSRPCGSSRRASARPMPLHSAWRGGGRANRNNPCFLTLYRLARIIRA
jgi:hypothetical protein